MAKKNKINTLGVVLWLFFMYISTYIYVSNTTENWSMKDYTYINKSLAEFNFFQEWQGNITPYEKSWEDLTWKWSSSNFPLKEIYNKVLVKSTLNPEIISNNIATQVNNTIILPVRHSH